jgi:collagenase-like PrtC family protease
VNIYNTETLQLLAELGLRRWVLPVELGVDTLTDLAPSIPADVETEIFAFGRLPLAYSARCFTARANNVPKDRCDFRCLDHPDGQLLSTQEDQPFLTVNGIQTLSALTMNLAGELDGLVRSQVDVLRLSPQSQHMLEIIDVFDTLRQEKQNVDPLELEQWMPVGPCCGYWHARPGHSATGHAATEG